jgi:hypothetical protein
MPGLFRRMTTNKSSQTNPLLAYSLISSTCVSRCLLAQTSSWHFTMNMPPARKTRLASSAALK